MTKRHVLFLGTVVFWVSWPLLHLILRVGSRTRVLIVAEGDVLLVKDIIGSGKWSLPGGGLHGGEKPIDGAKREVYEETGITLSADQLQPRGLFKAVNNEKHTYKYHLFVAQLDTKPTIVMQQRELSDITWMPRGKAAKHRSIGKVAQEIIATWSR